jgi:DNA processing protein
MNSENEQAPKTPEMDPPLEVISYEGLWSGISGVGLGQLGRVLQGRPPSKFYANMPEKTKNDVTKFLNQIRISNFNFLLRGDVNYPKELLSLDLPLLYFLGDLGLLNSRRISVIGSRKATPRGLAAAAKIARKLTAEGFTIVSGLALGIDTAAHQEAINVGGRTIAVIGTPINQAYPKENVGLQALIAKKHLLLSHVPFFKYYHQNFKINSRFFPERNKIMAAISEATIIIEATDKSGTMTQAKECLRLDKKLFILKPTFDDRNLTWPRKFFSKGAIIIEKSSDIIKSL